MPRWFSSLSRRLSTTAARFNADPVYHPDSGRPLVVEHRNPAADHAESIVVLVPIAPNIRRQFINSTLYLAQRAAARFRSARIVFDPRGAPPPPGKPHPYRQEALAKIRQDMIASHLGDADWVFWIDADIVDYPANLYIELIRRADGGIAAPVLLMDGKLGAGPTYADGFGWGRFFDVAGFVENRRWARFEPPWFDQPGPCFNLDSVGGCYAVSAEIYRKGARHEADPFAADLVARNADWPSDAIAVGQRGPAPCFTEHYSVCQWAKDHGYPVRAFADLTAFHAQL